MTPLDLRRAAPVLHTPRLRVALTRPDHAAAFCAGVAASRHRLQHVGWGLKPRDLAWAQRFCDDDARCIAEGRDLAWHVFAADDAADRQWLGRIDLHSIDPASRRGEVGYVGHAAHAGRGLMREAVRAVIGEGFRLGLARIEALSDTRNARALRFAEALGLRFEGVLHWHERDPQGLLCDMAVFAALNPAAQDEAAVPLPGPAGPPAGATPG